MSEWADPQTLPRVYFQITLSRADARAFWEYLTYRGPRVYPIAMLLLILPYGFLGMAVWAARGTSAGEAVNVLISLAIVSLFGFVVLNNRVQYRSARLTGAAQVWVDHGGFTVALNGVSVAVPWSTVTRWGLTRRHLVIVAHDEFGYAFRLDQFASQLHRQALTIGLQRHTQAHATGTAHLSAAERTTPLS